MGQPYKVVLRGFSAFERSALGSYFRLSADRLPGYEQVPALADADFAVADADQPAVVDELRRHGRMPTTVFVGAEAPAGAVAWTMRPIDPLHVMRELDAIAALHHLPPSVAPRAPGVPPPRNGNGGGNGFDHPQRRASDSQPGAFDDRPLDRAFAPPPLPSQGEARGRALVVDDSEIALRALERQLQARGVRAQRSTHSTQALEALARETFDFVLIDVDLGDGSELDGLGLCRHIKRQHHHPAGRPPVVLIVSAHAAPVDQVRGTLAGCDAYLAKPLDDAALRQALLRHGLPLEASAAAAG